MCYKSKKALKRQNILCSRWALNNFARQHRSKHFCCLPQMIWNDFKDNMVCTFWFEWFNRSSMNVFFFCSLFLCILVSETKRSLCKVFQHCLGVCIWGKYALEAPFFGKKEEYIGVNVCKKKNTKNKQQYFEHFACNEWIYSSLGQLTLQYEAKPSGESRVNLYSSVCVCEMATPAFLDMLSIFCQCL